MTSYFSGKNALIYGGAKGIGKAIAMEWAARGANVTIADIDEEAAKATAKEITDAGKVASWVRADVLNDDSVRSAAEHARQMHGVINIVMANVGAMLNGHPEDIPMSEWHRIMNLNYFGAVRAIDLFLPEMIKAGAGHLVTCASFAGLYPYAASRIPYAASKAAIIAMSENLALYLEPKGIRVSCLIPGPVMTGIMDSMTSWTEDCPMRGPGAELTLKMPDEVARTLSDGMRDGRILIPSDDMAWDIVQNWAASPDGFIRDRITRFESGDRGVPSLPDGMRRS